ncbi:hypothetical protein NUW58_g5026 [Xylaria curta]|uniref:Uncharacterized protein n=1 Tax=Xylaria curta TaxID=42375 RepID=A0ACC1P574_9PEZI|nr:hypothetical protein NUW58_g5026 [Xylaria curta]
MPDPKRPDVLNAFRDHVYKNSQISCPIAGCNQRLLPIDAEIGRHLASRHAEYLQGPEDIKAVIRDAGTRRPPCGSTPGPGAHTKGPESPTAEVPPGQQYATPHYPASPYKTPETSGIVDAAEDSTTLKYIKQVQICLVSPEQLMAELDVIYTRAALAAMDIPDTAIEDKAIPYSRAIENQAFQDSQDSTLIVDDMILNPIAIENQAIPDSMSTDNNASDLAQYAKILEDDIQDAQIWTSVAQDWYLKALHLSQHEGRIYHSLATVVEPYSLRKLFYFIKSRCVLTPFHPSGTSIITLFDIGAGSLQHADSAGLFIKAHGILLSNEQPDMPNLVIWEFLRSLDGYISRLTNRWREKGYQMAIVNCCALLSYGSCSNAAGPSRDLEDALNLAMGTHEVVFQRREDINVLPYVHVVMVFTYYLTQFPEISNRVDDRFPWKSLLSMLNALSSRYKGDRSRLFNSDSPIGDGSTPLREDDGMKGLLFAGQYFPNSWFSNPNLDDDENCIELQSVVNARTERILWLGYKIARSRRGLTYREGADPFRLVRDDQLMIEEEMNINIDITFERGGEEH